MGPDRKFVAVLASAAAAAARPASEQINVVLNWFEELKAKVAVK